MTHLPVLGIDEAGRGPVLGPMVMACVALRSRQAARLTRAGVTDSKAFTGPLADEARRALIPQIIDAADFVSIEVIDVAELDRRCRRGDLNRLEQERADLLIRRAPPCRRIICDGHRLFAPLIVHHPYLEAINHGELAHAAVAAASIVAKVRRDELWRKIARRYAVEFGEELVARGSGYVNQATRAFLRAYIERHRCLPPEARRSWPWEFARDLLGTHFDPYHDVPDEPAQLPLFRSA